MPPTLLRDVPLLRSFGGFGVAVFASCRGGAARASKGGFTLVELLVALVIIGILSALLFPVFGKMQEKQKTSRTVSHLRQLQVANITYATDHNGNFAPLFAGPGVFELGWKWNEAFLTYLGVQVGESGWQKLLFSGHISDRYPRSEIAYSVTRTPSGESLWASAAAGVPHGLPQLSINRPSTLVAFIDANDWWVEPWRYNEWSSRETGDVQNPSVLAATAYRNPGGVAAAVTYGGSVQMIAREELNPASEQGARRWFFDAP